MIIVYFLSLFGIAFFIKETDLMNWFRILLLQIHPVFLKLLECYFCLGFWVGVGSYPFIMNIYSIVDHILWSFGSASLCLIMSSVVFFFQGKDNSSKSF